MTFILTMTFGIGVIFLVAGLEDVSLVETFRDIAAGNLPAKNRETLPPGISGAIGKTTAL